MNEIDNRGSHFYLALYWAEALANQLDDSDLKGQFIPVFEELSNESEKIAAELIACQGEAQKIDGYYTPNEELTAKAMRPSETFNGILEGVLA